jgi:hypothetical protein
VPWRSSGKIAPMPYRARVPATPPTETNSKDFRAELLSGQHRRPRE